MSTWGVCISAEHGMSEFTHPHGGFEHQIMNSLGTPGWGEQGETEGSNTPCTAPHI